MKMRAIVFCFLITGGATLAHAGNLNIVGDVNVSSNFSAQTMTFAGSTITLQLVNGAMRVSTNVTESYGVRINQWGIGVGWDATPGEGQELFVGGSIYGAGDITIEGKVSAYSGIDPPYLLLDAETRDSIAIRVAREVPPSKQTGAALFWNYETKQLEIYVASEGAFYDLAGKNLLTIKQPVVDGQTVTTTYRLDRATGEVLEQDAVKSPVWQLKKGYKIDQTTGALIQTGDDTPPRVVTPSEALEQK